MKYLEQLCILPQLAASGTGLSTPTSVTSSGRNSYHFFRERNSHDIYHYEPTYARLPKFIQSFQASTNNSSLRLTPTPGQVASHQPRLLRTLDVQYHISELVQSLSKFTSPPENWNSTHFVSLEVSTLAGSLWAPLGFLAGPRPVYISFRGIIKDLTTNATL